MKFLKKAIPLCLLALILVICISLLTPKAEAATVSSGTCGDDLTWTLDDTGTLTISGTGPMTNGSYSSEMPWHSNRSAIKNVVIEFGVTTIGSYAFSYCYSLETVTIPDSVATIGNNAFWYCTSLQNISIPNNITYLGYSLFYRCEKLRYNIYDNAMYLGNADNPYVVLIQAITNDIANCQIHPHTKIIGDSAFSWCEKLQSVKIPGDVTAIGSNAFTGCTGLTEIVIPDGVTTIGQRAFDRCENLQSILIPDSVTQIEADAFVDCGSLKYNIYGNGKYLGNSINPYVVLITAASNTCEIHPDTRIVYYGTFSNCSNLQIYITDLAAWCGITFEDHMPQDTKLYLNDKLLTNLLIPEGVINVGTYAFAYLDSIQRVSIPESVVAIGDYAFYDCDNLQSIEIPDSVETIGNYAFSNCDSLLSAMVGNGVTTMGTDVFKSCALLQSVVIGNRVTSIETRAFSSCSRLQSITIGNSVNRIGEYAFSNCGLQNITVPDSVTIIDERAFYYCQSLHTITLGSGVTDIGSQAFDVSRVSKVYIKDFTAWSQVNFHGSESNPLRSTGHLCILDEDGNEVKELTIDKTVVQIPSASFYNCQHLEKIWVDAENPVYSSDDQGALYDKNKTILIKAPGKNREDFLIPNTVITIGNAAFSCDGQLRTVTIPSSVTTVENKAFVSCYNLQSVYYEGSYEQWEQVGVGIENSYLTKAVMYYNHTHDYTIVAPKLVPATCTQEGYIEYTCMYGETYRDVLPALGHSAGTDKEVVAPTCTEQGYIQSTCTRCGQVGNSDFTDSLGHDFCGEATVIVGCTTQGYTETKCTRCNATEKSNYTDSVGHNIVVLPMQAATCTQDGYSSAGTECSRCKQQFIVPTPVPALGHDYVNHDGQLPTCEEDGWKPYQTCTRCDYTSFEALPALGHRVSVGAEQLVDPFEISNNSSVPFTITDGVYYSNNHSNSSSSALVITATHTFRLKLTYGVSSESGCDKLTVLYNGSQQDSISGTVTGRVLYFDMVPGDVITVRYSKDGSVNNGSDQGWVELGYEQVIDTVYTDVSADALTADCINSVVCSYCQSVVQAATGHAYVDHEGQAVTCEAPGWNAYQTCEHCDYSTYEELPAIGHHWVQYEAKAPGCVLVGWEAYQACKNCGSSTYKEIPAIRHNYVDGICTNCQGALTEQPGDLTGDGVASNDDVIVLLWYSLFPSTVTGDMQVDYNGDGKFTNADVIKLLWYVLFPDLSPI